jgi:nitroreductase
MKRNKGSAMKVYQLTEERFGRGMPLPEDGAGSDTLIGLLSHRSHRAYTEDPVDENLLTVLMACALSSPSKSDLQQADIIRVRDPEKRRVVSELIPSMPWVEDAPVFLVFCGNGRRVRQLSELRGSKFANDHLDAFFNAAVDAAIVMATFINAAEAVGLGCCPISVVRNHCEELNALLELPDWVFPVAGMCLGYPQSEGRLSQRLPLDVTTHTDVFDEAGLEARIEAYDRRRAAALPEPERYFWSEAKARQYSEPQRREFGAYIRRKGFDLS